MLPFPTVTLGKVVQGTCGWTDDSLMSCNRFYPVSARSSNDKLYHYSRGGGFGCVEVDSSTYAIPIPKIVDGWAKSTPPGFLFHFKAFSALCYQSLHISKYPRSIQDLCLFRDKNCRITELPELAQDRLWGMFNEALSPAHLTERLGCVVFQFHLDFDPFNEAHVNYLSICASKLNPLYRIAFDFRNRDWLSPEILTSIIPVLRSLRPNGIAIVASDDLEHELYGSSFRKDSFHGGNSGVPIVFTSASCSDFTYVRVHRRQGSHRLLSSVELEAWSTRIKAIYGLSSKDKSTTVSQRDTFLGTTFFLWGTDHEDQGVVNAKNLFALLPSELQIDWRLHTKNMKGGVLDAFRSMNNKIGSSDTNDDVVRRRSLASSSEFTSELSTHASVKKNAKHDSNAKTLKFFFNKHQTPTSASASNAIAINDPEADATLTFKKYHIEVISTGFSVDIFVQEYISAELALFTWASAGFLASYLVSNKESLVLGKVILEIGGGTGLPSFAASKLGAAAVTVSDRPHQHAVNVLTQGVLLNGIQHNCSVECLDWSNGLSGDVRYFDMILGSDVFYSTEDFDYVLATVVAFMEINPKLIFLTTYQQRSTKRSLAPFLAKYGLFAECIPLESFYGMEIRPGDASCRCVFSVEEVQPPILNPDIKSDASHDKKRQRIDQFWKPKPQSKTNAITAEEANTKKNSKASTAYRYNDKNVVTIAVEGVDAAERNGGSVVDVKKGNCNDSGVTEHPFTSSTSSAGRTALLAVEAPGDIFLIRITKEQGGDIL